MATFHYLALRAFAHETEDPERVKTALAHVAHGADLALEETVVDGSHKNRIRILEGELKSAPAAKELFAQIARDDPQGYAQLKAEADKRLDEHLNFYVRLDKQEAYQGRMRLAHDEDAVLVRGKLRSFEAKRLGSPLAAARDELERFFQAVDRSVTP